MVERGSKPELNHCSSRLYAKAPFRHSKTYGREELWLQFHDSGIEFFQYIIATFLHASWLGIQVRLKCRQGQFTFHRACPWVVLCKFCSLAEVTPSPSDLLNITFVTHHWCSLNQPFWCSGYLLELNPFTYWEFSSPDEVGLLWFPSFHLFCLHTVINNIFPLLMGARWSEVMIEFGWRATYQWTGRTSSWSQMNRLSLRNNQLKFKTFRAKPIILKGIH